MVVVFNTYNKNEVVDIKRDREEKRRLKEMKIEAQIARDKQATQVLARQQQQMIEGDKHRGY